MRTSDKGIMEILSHEGVVTRRYKDSVGVWTFGVGHTANAGPPDPASITKDCSLAEIITVFRHDLSKFELRVEEAVKVPMQQHEFDALVSFDFNTGGIFRAKITERLNAGDRAGAAMAFDNWHQPPEIIPRRNKEKALFAGAKYSSNGYVTVWPASDAGQVLWSQGKRVDMRPLLDTPPWPPGPRVLARGMAGEDVKEWQADLRSQGYAVTPDGDFDVLTEAATKAFQKAHGLQADGFVGPLTRTAMAKLKLPPVKPPVPPVKPPPVEKPKGFWAGLFDKLFGGKTE